MKLSVISDGGRGLGFVHDMAMVSELCKFFSKKVSALIEHPLFFKSELECQTRTVNMQ